MSDKVTTIKVNTPPGNHGGGDLVLMRNFIQLLLGKASGSVAPLEDGIKSALVCIKAKEAAEKDEYRFIDFR